MTKSALETQIAYATKLAFGLDEMLCTLHSAAYDVVNEGETDQFENVLQRIVHLTDVAAPAVTELTRLLGEDLYVVLGQKAALRWEALERILASGAQLHITGAGYDDTAVDLESLEQFLDARRAGGPA